MTARYARTDALIYGQRILLLLMVALTLAPSLLGRAGFQEIEKAVAARIFPLHQHGVPGEAEYIRRFGQPAPFVHPHCHPEPDQPPSDTPSQLALGGLLFGPLLCGDDLAPLAQPSAAFGVDLVRTLPPTETILTPLTPPPQG
ncbi:MAG: hypothetical protein ACRDJE_15285 [Dehalococcoidia bacterium]